MKCSDCKLFRTDRCRNNPGGKDLDFADSFACFEPGGTGARPSEEARPRPAAKVEKKREPIKEAKPEPPAEAEKEREKAEAAKEPEQPKQAAPEPAAIADKSPEPVIEAKPEPAKEPQDEPPTAPAEARAKPRRERRPAAVPATGDRAPWGWGTLLLISFLGGFAGSGIIAGLNWRRLGRPVLMLPTIAIMCLAFAFWLVLPALLHGQTMTLVPISMLANPAAAWLLWLWQGKHYDAWAKSHANARPAGWLLPALALVFVWGVVAVVYVVYNFL